MNQHIDPELEMQEHGDWFTDLVMWLCHVLRFWPTLLLGVFYGVIVTLFLAVLVHHLTR